MKKLAVFAMSIILILSLVGCGERKDAGIKETVNGNLNTYYEMNDGTWRCNDISYKYRLEIKGRMPMAACDSTYVYLSNLENITFEQAWKAGGLGEDTSDYFDEKDAVLVEMSTSPIKKQEITQ